MTQDLRRIWRRVRCALSVWALVWMQSGCFVYSWPLDSRAYYQQKSVAQRKHNSSTRVTTRSYRAPSRTAQSAGVHSLQPGAQFGGRSNMGMQASSSRSAGASPSAAVERSGLRKLPGSRPGLVAAIHPKRVSDQRGASTASTLAQTAPKVAVPDVRRSKPIASAAGTSPHATGRRYPMRWPLEGAITTRFGRQRGRTNHDGIDIRAPKGTHVKAAAPGEVLFADRHGGYGNLVVVRHDDGLVTVYAHHDVNLVSKGDKVDAGQTVGKVGQTGRATGPHLHFEVRRGVTPQNPLLYLPP